MHLVMYEEAVSDVEKALMALKVIEMEDAHLDIWSWEWGWANTAVDHAIDAGVPGESINLGDGRYPDTDQLEKDLKLLQQHDSTLKDGDQIERVPVNVWEADWGETEQQPQQVPLCVCDFDKRNDMTMDQYEKADGHFNDAGGWCCPHKGNTCGYCHQNDH